MKKISKIGWSRYKDSEAGKKVIETFGKMLDPKRSLDEIIKIAKHYDSLYFKNMSPNEVVDEKNCIYNYKVLISILLKKQEGRKFSEETAEEFYCQLLRKKLGYDKDFNFEDIPQADFKWILSDNLAMSIMLYSYIPEFFIPNFMVTQFMYMDKFAEKYEIELPKVPKRSDYRGRCLYYLDICLKLNEFSAENGFETAAEFCAFIYDYEFPLIKEDIENNLMEDLPETPEQSWLLVGNYSEGEKNMESGLWQANQMTSRGDIMLFYEKSPVKKMNSAWIALEDGRIDPFAPYYSYTYIGKKITFPDEQAITFEEFKNSVYFKNKGSKGNFVSKNFQDTSGWPIPFDDYVEILRMLSSKGFDISALPSLYEPEEIATDDIHNENDVYNKLVTPMLEQMGWKIGEDFEREVPFAAGHGTTGHAMNKRPDYCLHITREGKKVYAKVVIEAKFFIKDKIELDDTFDQCLTYASWGQAKVLVLCDRRNIFVYEQDSRGHFIKGHHRTKYTWGKLRDLEVFKELKRKLDI